MKRCTTCSRTFDDETLSFCLDDGMPLLTEGVAQGASGETIAARAPAQTFQSSAGESTTQDYGGLGGKATWTPSQGQISEIQQYVAAKSRRPVWPWVVIAILAVLVIGIATIVVVAVLSE